MSSNSGFTPGTRSRSAAVLYGPCSRLCSTMFRASVSEMTPPSSSVSSCTEARFRTEFLPGVGRPRPKKADGSAQNQSARKQPHRCRRHTMFHTILPPPCGRVCVPIKKQQAYHDIFPIYFSRIILLPYVESPFGIPVCKAGLTPGPAGVRSALRSGVGVGRETAPKAPHGPFSHVRHDDAPEVSPDAMCGPPYKCETPPAWIVHFIFIQSLNQRERPAPGTGKG